MSDDNVLSQDEIDALLDDMGGDEEPSKEDSSGEVGITTDDLLKANQLSGSGEENNSTGPVNIDFTNQERIVRGQLPVLEKVYDRMIKNVMEDFFVMMSRDLQITQEPFSIIKSMEFMTTLKPPLYISIVKAHPLRGKMLIIFDGLFIYELVEHYYGGHSEYAVKIDHDKDFTATEQIIVDKVSEMINKQNNIAWDPITELKLDIIGSETNPQLINAYTPTDLLVVTRFMCQFEKDAGSFFIVFPYSMIEPIRERLELGLSHGDDEYDPRWSNAIKSELLRSKLEVSAVMAKKIISLEDVSGWNVDDFIPLEMEDEIPIYIEGILCFKGKVGTNNSKCAVEVIRKVKHE